MDTTDIVVGGGGIIGLTVALELARSGLRVTVLERGRAMAEASWAAAGMLAAEDPENPAELSELAVFSRSLYPEYLKTVERASGRCVPLRTHGTVQASQPGGVFHGQDSPTRFAITEREAGERIAGLAPGGRSFLWMREDSLDPRDLCAALPLAAIAAGVTLREGTEVFAVENEDASVKVRTSQGTASAGGFVNCCGAWAAAVEGSLPASERSRELVEPLKGQIVTVRLDGQQQLQCVLRTPDVYLVPRGNGRVVVGATLERAGYDRQVDSGAVERLLAKAAEIWPPIASCPIVESWAGLRPGTSDGLPLIGPAGAPRCWFASGHFRNGILLAPATGAVLRQLIQGQAPAVVLDAFLVRRTAIRMDLPGASSRPNDNGLTAAL